MSTTTRVPQNRRDPTGTATVRDRYARRLRRPLRDLNTRIREGVRERDVFGLQLDILERGEGPPLMRFDPDPRKRELFDDWLQTQIDTEILEVIDRDQNQFVRAGYERGLKDADQALAAVGVDTPGGEVASIMQLGVHRDAVERLYASNYADLKDITREVSRQIGEELAEGFAAGDGPDAIARRITDRVDKVGKTRATTLAQTRIIDAHSEATLNRFSQFGVSNVRVRAEWSTAGDDRVCPICANLEGSSWTIEEARQGTVTLTEDDVRPHMPDPKQVEELSVDHLTGEFPIRPPAHARCRCRLLPEIR